MKKIILLTSLLFTHYLVQAQWSPLTSGTTEMLRSVNFINTNLGYACGNNGTILKTTNSGLSWNSISSSTYAGFMFWDIEFFNSDTGIVVGESDPGSNPCGNGCILRTTDGGTSWTPVYVSAGKPVRDFFIANADTLYACGGAEATYSQMLRSTDGGITWTNTGTPYYDAMLGGLLFFDSNNGVLGKYESVFGNTAPTVAQLLSTTNGLGTVSASTFANSGAYWNFASDLGNSSTGFMSRATYAGIDAVYINKTTDGGISWNETAISNFTGSIYGMDFLDANTGYICGNNNTSAGTILKTTTGGTSWASDLSVPNACFRDVQFVSSTLGFAVGDNGIIYKYDSSPNGIAAAAVIGFSLFPNPSADQLHIRCPEMAEEIVIYEGTGKIIEVLHPAAQAADLNTRNLANGYYFLRITLPDQTLTEPFIVQH